MTVEDVVAYLLEHRLLEVRDLVDGDLQVDEVTGRNRNLRAVTGTGGGYFFKQAPERAAEGGALLAVEAEVYRRVEQDPRYVPLRPFLPRLCRYDLDRDLLVLELASAARTPYEFDEVDSTFGLARASDALGLAVAACHAVIPTRGDGSHDDEFLSRSPPWVLGVARPHPDALRDLSRAQAQVIHLVQGCPNIGPLLDELREGWVATSLIHGDLKWANVLLDADPDGHPRSVRLVDWELAGLGDAAWDVGSVLHSYLAHLVLALPVEDDAGPAAAAEAFAVALPSMQEEHRRFWAAYVGAAEVLPGATASFLDRVVRFCGARLLQSAFEWSQEEDRMPRSAAAVLQLSMNVLHDPVDARGALLGLPDPLPHR